MPSPFQTTATVDMGMLDTLDDLAAKQGVTRPDLIRAALEEYIESPLALKKKENLVRSTVVVDTGMLDTLDDLAAKQEVSRLDLIRAALQEYIDRHEKNHS